VRQSPPVFFDDDYHAYLALMQDACKRVETAVLAYCLMPNHVHFIMVPCQAFSILSPESESACPLARTERSV
jgi:putative transposase